MASTAPLVRDLRADLTDQTDAQAFSLGLEIVARSQ
jgi:hypothetical protein